MKLERSEWRKDESNTSLSILFYIALTLEPSKSGSFKKCDNKILKSKP